MFRGVEVWPWWAQDRLVFLWMDSCEVVVFAIRIGGSSQRIYMFGDIEKPIN